MSAEAVYSWDIVVPAQRYVFAIEDTEVLEFNEPDDLPADRFRRYQEIKSDHPVHGMIAWPNTVLLRGPRTVLIDPGIITQGPPVLLGLARLGVDIESIDMVINTHHHVDHTHANAYFAGTTGVMHMIEYDRYLADYRLGFEPSSLRRLKGRHGAIAPGLDFLLTPGHTEGSICVAARVEEGVLVVAGDTVGPMPEYFDRMELPENFPGRDDLLESWRRIRELRPQIVIPGHNPPMWAWHSG